MADRTLCFLLEGSPPKVLLGLKKIGFGEGKYTGFGGKVEPGESIAVAAARELEEEAGIKIAPEQLEKAGYLTFLFPSKPNWNQVVHVFLLRTWEGEPLESKEMKPVWFRTDGLPFKKMWQDAPYWLPHILENKCIKAVFTFNEDNETIDSFEVEDWIM